MAAYKCKCGVSGKENFYSSSKYYCKSCWNELTFQKAREKLNQLIEERGGKCEVCGYNKYFGALQWHHIDPTQKEFSISTNRGKSIDALRKETSKCQLLCSNCHAEAHANAPSVDKG
jgi:predicted HNH restriction endonuclease